MSLTYAGELLRRYVVLFLLAVLVGGGAGFALASRPPTYATTTSLLVRPRTPADSQQYLAKPERFIRSQIRLATGDEVLSEALRRVGSNASLHTFREVLEVDGGSTDDVIDVTVTGEGEGATRARAAAVAAVYAGATKARAEVLGLDSERLGLSKARTIALGAAGGGAFGLLLVLMLGAARRPVMSSKHLRMPPGVVVFPFDLPQRREGAGESDGYDMLYSLLRNSEEDGHHRVLVAGIPAHAGTAVEEGLADVSKHIPALPAGHPDALDSGLQVERIGRADNSASDHGWRSAVLVCAIERGTPEASLMRYVEALSPVVGSSVVVVVEKAKKS